MLNLVFTESKNYTESIKYSVSAAGILYFMFLSWAYRYYQLVAAECTYVFNFNQPIDTNVRIIP